MRSERPSAFDDLKLNQNWKLLGSSTEKDALSAKNCLHLWDLSVWTNKMNFVPRLLQKLRTVSDLGFPSSRIWSRQKTQLWCKVTACNFLFCLTVCVIVPLCLYLCLSVSQSLSLYFVSPFQVLISLSLYNKTDRQTQTHTHTHTNTHTHTYIHTHTHLSLIHIWRCRRDVLCRSRWSPYH